MAATLGEGLTLLTFFMTFLNTDFIKWEKNTEIKSREIIIKSNKKDYSFSFRDLNLTPPELHKNVPK